ncbi:amino acid adenylation domain-containing protein [Chitinophaga sp. Mgbs1]|uniref:Amino acid adenylation domain-containing protein n=1 Tax=Chitinophaga solisilvae TaxID=1233460 RepID=A0A3S1JKD0_9BACT|nr:amino acid adenylation domain-containing protein [Chitinophaga solisilvae]
MKKLLMDLKENNILLEVVDGELKVFADSNPDPSLIAEIKLRKAELLQLLSGNTGGITAEETVPHITPAPAAESYALSSSQRRLWVIHQLEPDSTAYNLKGTHVFEGRLDQQALEQAFSSLVERHEILRTVFRTDEEGTAGQYILSVADARMQIQQVDARELSAAALNSLVLQEVNTPFDLAAGPLLRATLFRTAGGSWVFCYVMHHIIGDAWSTGVLVKELLVLYNAFTKGESNPLKPLRIQYRDYAVWQQEQLNGPALQEHKSYWLQQFEEDAPVLQLAPHQPRPAVRSYNGDEYTHIIGPELTAAIKKLCAAEGGTLFMAMLALVKTLLYRYTGQEDIVIGTSIASRENVELENQIGFYVNTLPMRTRFTGKDSFRKLLSGVKAVTLDAYAHQAYPFDELVEVLNPVRDAGRHPLFDVMVVLQNIDVAREEQAAHLDGVDVKGYGYNGKVVSKFDLTFFVLDDGERLLVRTVYNTDIFGPALIHQLSTHLQQLMEAVTEDCLQPLSDLPMLDEATQQQLLRESISSVIYEDTTVVDLFRKQAQQAPDATALVAGRTSLTYGQLQDESDRLAEYLRTTCGITADDRVGILLQRSEKVLVAMIAVLKAGGAYVMIEPEMPESRKRYMVTDAGIRAMITQSDFLFDIHYYDGQLFAIDIQLESLPAATAAPAVISPEHLAYIVYTSGTTGAPKGVMVTHRNLADYYYGLLAATNIGACRSFGLVSTPAADLGNTVIYASLLTGGALHIFSADEVMNGEKMRQHQVDCIKIVPSHWKALQDDNSFFLPEKCIVFGGETLTADVIETIRKVRPACEIYNHYGPSETTIGKLVRKVDEPSRIIPLGKPFGNTAVYILDQYGKLLPAWATGEICIGGRGVSKGYLQQPELTALQFITDPFHADRRIYKTGDLGLRLPGGDIIFLGRKDNQLKIRGYRIELEEIEHALLKHPDINTAVVQAFEHASGDRELAAYWTGDHEMDAGMLRTHLAASLPLYMLPAHYIRLEQLPLTANGKIDRRRLPAPQEAADAAYVAPRNEIEEQLAALWREILKRKRVSVKDNFFDIGGHSLRATRLVSMIHKTYSVSLELKDIFASLVLEDQAVLIANARKTGWMAIEPAPVSDSGYPVSSAQYRMWILSQLEEGNIAYNVPTTHIFHGAVSPEALQAAFNSMIARHEVLRTIFHATEDGAVNQIVLPADKTGFSITLHDFRKEAAGEALADEVADIAARQPFNLSTGPLIRASLICLSDDKWVFVFVIHHIICDGWSKEILLKELLQFYQQYQQPENIALTPLRIQYKDYAVWQRASLESEVMQAHKNYWIEQCSGELPVLEMPADRPRPPRKTYNGATVGRFIPEATMNALNAVARENESTLFMALLAAVNTLLYRYTGHEDIIIGTTVAGREHTDLEDQIGFYVNTLPVRMRFSGDDSFHSLLQHARQVMLQGFEHQAYPFDELVTVLDADHDISRNPLFDVTMVLQNVKEITSNQGQTGESARRGITSRFDLTFNFVESSDGLRVSLIYNTDLYNDNTAWRLLFHLENIICDIAHHADKPVWALEYLATAERAQLIHDFNAPASPCPQEWHTGDAFRQQAAATPDKTAIAANGTTITYKELDERSDKLAVYLRENYNITGGDLVGVLLEKTEKAVIAILGILKAGAAYVPIDPAFPSDRKNYMLQQAGCKAILTHIDYIPDLYSFEGSVIAPEVEEHLIEACEIKHYTGITGNDLAYVMFTSGSSGEPKGVMIEHHGIRRLVKDCGYIDLKASDVLLASGAVAFDVTTFEYWSMLLNGGTLVLAGNDALLDKQQLSALLSEHAVNMMLLTVARLHQLVEDDVNIFAGLEAIFAGGEQMSLRHAHAILAKFPDLLLLNCYGPTENTTNSTVGAVRPEHTVISIGKPVTNGTAYILDGRQQLCAVGIKGELYVGGGLARGYINNEALTAERFVADPFREGARMYKTGDIARWLPDGNIVFEGRVDDQVKINGYRVEPDEVASILKGYPDMGSTVVIAGVNVNGEKELWGYFVSHVLVDITALRTYMAGKVPAFMVPSSLIQLGELPLNVNGKIDRKQLPRPDNADQSSGAPYVAPRNQVEEKLLLLWQEVLGRAIISVKDSFFDIGGHSLRATRLASLIYKTFDVNITLKDIFAFTVLEEQAELIRQAKKESFVAIAPAPPSDNGYPLSSSQYRLWILSQFEEVSIAYNVKDVHVFSGELNPAALQYAFDAVIGRHEVLRTVFRHDDTGELRQFVLEPAALGFAIARHDLRGEDNAAAIALQLVRKDFVTPFNMATGPLVRASLIQRAEGEWVFTYVTHHIISDGWSRGILIDELMKCYRSYRDSVDPELQPLRIQYKDYAVWQQEQLTADLLKEHREYWLQQFSGALPVLELPTDKVRPAVKTYNGAAWRKNFSKELSQRIQQFTTDQESTLFMMMVAAVNALLYHYAAQDDIIIGTPVAGREHADLEDQIGFYVNTLALRTQFSGHHSFRELLQQVKKVALGAYEHQLYPFDKLVGDLDVQRDRSRNPLFDIQVIVQQAVKAGSSAEEQSQQLTMSGYDGIGTISCVFDLVFDFAARADGLQLRLAYNTDIYSQWMIQQLGDQLEQFLSAALSNPDTAIGEVTFLSSDDRQQLLHTFNQTAADFAPDKTIIQLFEAQAARTPDSTALVFNDTALTYAELNERAEQLGAVLQQTYNIRTNDLVGIMLDRSAEVIISMLGILKAGAAFVPVNPDYPRGRKEFIFKDTGISTLITETSRMFELDYFDGALYMTDIPVAAPPAGAVNQAGPGDLAYVIYTSGSTGEPKGVMVENGGLANTIQGMQAFFDIPAGYRNMQITSFSFDASVFETFNALTCGAALYVVSDDIRDNPLLLEQFITDNRIDFALIPPAYLRMLDVGKISTLKKLVTAGEAALADKARAFLQYGEYYNAYGPTETSICASVMPVPDAKSIAGDNVPIGRPIANSPVYILDAQDQLTPVGVIGEICVGGSGIARGYLNKPEQTAAKFVPDPFAPGRRMYRTGDLGRWLPGGILEYTGRKDEQIKINGHRIEPGEIENALLRYPGVDAVVVTPVLKENGENELAAYLVGAAPLYTNELITHLSGLLPLFMIPAWFVQLDSLPLTSNGKIDKKALPYPGDAAVNNVYLYTAPEGPEELLLAAIWQEVLGREQVGRTDDYFELGGNSLKAMIILKKILDVTGVTIPMKVLFEEKNVAAIARHIPVGTVILPSYNQQVYFSGWNRKGDHLIVMPYEGAEIRADALTAAVNQLADRHEMLRTAFVKAGSVVLQRILPPGALRINVEGPVQLQQDEALDTIIKEEYNWEADLAAAPLFRVKLFHCANGRHVALITMHHIITDGYSIGIIKNELTALYIQQLTGAAPPPPLKFQYRDFSGWQRNHVASAAGQESLRYWKTKLEGCRLQVAFPAWQETDDGPNNLVLLLEGSRYQEIAAFSKKHGVTRTTLLMGVLTLLVHRLSGQQEVALCTTVSGRNSIHFGPLDVTGLIGFFANMMIVRHRIEDAGNPLALLKAVQSGFLDDLQHDACPFGEVVRALGIDTPDLLRSAVFFNYHNYNSDLEAAYEGNIADGNKDGEHMQLFGMVLVVKEYSNCLKLNFIFNRNIFPYTQRIALRNLFAEILNHTLNAR